MYFFLLGPEVGGDLPQHLHHGQKLSRQHLEVYRIERGFAFRDLESTNGVYLNGVKAFGVNLCQGDQLQVGNLVLVYHEAVL